MTISQNSINKLVPDGLPSNLANSTLLVTANNVFTDEVLRRSFLWANAILSRLYPSPFFASDIPLIRVPSMSGGISHISAGFVYIDPKNTSRVGKDFLVVDSFAFGAYALAHSKAIQGQDILTIDVSGRKVPLVINYGNIETHGSPPNPAGGTGCCWVRNRVTPGSWDYGILISRHVLSSLVVGDFISFTPSLFHPNPTSGTLADFDQFSIDAAVVGINNTSWPTGLSLTSISTAVAPGTTSVNLNGQYTSTTGTVLRIFQNPTYFGNLLGQRIITDCHGVPGDSGALLTESSNDALGIYMGTIPDGGGGKEGIFQDLLQVQNYFNLDLYY